MFKKTILGSLFAGGLIIGGHCYYNKNKDLNYCSMINEYNINKCNLLSDNMKKNLINLLDKYK
tara:strand:+ start:1004 stop:1192 length:189 start_codon:yes stop_codon:yes gene_type:complete